MAIRQLYIDGTMTGPSHGSGIPGPRLPTADSYDASAEIRAGDGTILARVVKGDDGRERYYQRNTGDGAPTAWAWRDTIREEPCGDYPLRVADRCDGSGTVALY